MYFIHQMQKEELEGLHAISKDTGLEAAEVWIFRIALSSKQRTNEKMLSRHNAPEICFQIDGRAAAKPLPEKQIQVCLR